MPIFSSKNTSKLSKYRWSDNGFEKLSDSVPKTIGLSQQVKGLFNPDNMLDHFFGQKGAEGKPSEFEPPKTKQEFLIFSRTHKEDQEKIIKESQIILQKLDEQISILTKEEKGLSHDLTKIKVEQMPRKSGIYYLRFLEWLLLVVKHLRVKVEEGRMWLATFSQRRKKRLGYWQMYKKHGTTFGLSHERVLATQTG